MQTPQPDVSKNKPVPEVAKHASWLYWVAALSLANIVLILFNANVGFAISLGLTDFLAVVGQSAGGGFKTAAMVMSLALIAFMGVLGYFACRAAVWAIVTGLVVLVLDTGLLLMSGVDALISVAIHVWAIISLVMGLRAAIAYRSQPRAVPGMSEIGSSQDDGSQS